MATTLLDKIERLEAEGPIEISSMDFTIEDPEVVRTALAYPLAYSEAVEIEVPITAEVVRTILPHMSKQKARFIDIWDMQETVHGELLGVSRRQLGIAPLATRDVIPGIMKFVSLLARVSPGMHDVTEMVYLTEGAMSERETLLFYNHFRDRLKAIGEVPMAGLVSSIARQEAAHLAFYMQAANEKRDDLSDRQLAFVQRFIEASYMPVGVRNSHSGRERQRHFGRVALDISGNKPETFTDPVEALARDLLGIVEDTPNTFLRKRYWQCIEEYQESVAA